MPVRTPINTGPKDRGHEDLESSGQIMLHLGLHRTETQLDKLTAVLLCKSIQSAFKDALHT